MTGAELRNASAGQDPVTGEAIVSFELNEAGTQIFADFTAAHIGEMLAIVLDKEVISSPQIDSAITEGAGIISGRFNLETANQLAVQLRYGALPIPLRVVETRIVGPTLGQDSLQKSLVAGAVGITIVMLFMLLYYRLPGLVAILSLLAYASIIFALFRTIPVTLTLAGIAGLMLGTGSTLDANILIYERLKEELRAGKSLRNALELCWDRAWPSIRDSNIATIITSLILLWFGSTFGATIVQGFALTLLIGVGVSLFTATTVTRSFLGTVLALYQPKNLALWFGI
jgi:preprotein translocase subunit SecD